MGLLRAHNGGTQARGRCCDLGRRASSTSWQPGVCFRRRWPRQSRTAPSPSSAPRCHDTRTRCAWQVA
eukprot:10927977-Lingulodinium_polyedra.AAC.1